MSPAIVYGTGLAVCAIGLAIAAYLLGVPVSWIGGAAVLAVVAGVAIARRRARRREAR